MTFCLHRKLPLGERPQGGLPMRARCSSSRYFSDPLGSGTQQKADPKGRGLDGADTVTGYVIGGADSPSQSGSCLANALWCDCHRQSLPSRFASLLPKGEPLRHVPTPSGSGQFRSPPHRARIGCGESPPRGQAHGKCQSTGLAHFKFSNPSPDKKIRKYSEEYFLILVRVTGFEPAAS